MPLVWTLLGHRVGDNLQVEALAKALGWPVTCKSLVWKTPLPRWTPVYGRGRHLDHLSNEARSSLTPPWPDLVISVGWRSVPVARWIRAQCNARLVHIGRPRAPLSAFDLVLTTPQYRLPEAPNILRLSGPLTALSKEARESAARTWRDRIADLPKPRTTVLVGGDTPTQRFLPQAAEDLASACNAHMERIGGSLLVATSPRTSAEVAERLRAKLKEPRHFHQWSADTENPYAAFLELADQVIVTDDSVSMTQDAVLTGKPVHIFALAPDVSLSDRALEKFDKHFRKASGPLGKAYQGLMRNGVIFPPKVPADYFETLFQTGRAVRLGAAPAQNPITPLQAETDRAVSAVRSLFDPTSAK